MKQPPNRMTRKRLAITARLTPVVTWLIGISVAAFLLFSFSGKATQAQLAGWLVLTPASLLAGHVWKLLTTAFFTDSGLAFFIDLLVLFFFMPFLEKAWGTRRFVTFALVSILVANLVAALAGIALGGAALLVPIAGLTPFIYAGIVGYGVDYAEQPLQFFGVVPMKGKVLAIGMSVVVVLATLLNGAWVTGAGHIAALIAGFLMTSHSFTPKLWLLRWRHARLRKRYKVLDGGASKKWLN